MKSAPITRTAVFKYIAAGLTFFILSTILAGFIVMQFKVNNQQKLIQTTQRYAIFEDRIRTFLVKNENMISGFSSYIQTYDDYRGEDAYTFLSFLMDKNSYYIKNIGVIEDTTIIWNYPYKGNEKAIGTDLAKIPAQAETIDYIKATMQCYFDGPINLVQGGTGYIMRVPIKKNNAYWGMVSIVLKTERLNELFDSYAKECGIKVAIINQAKGNRLVYGDKKILDQHPARFDSSFEGTNWTIYAINDEHGSDRYAGLITIIAIMGLFFVLLSTAAIFRIFQVREEMEKENNILNQSVIKDSLTGIYNRNYFDKRIAEETEKVNRYGGNLSMIYFDLDHFKIINDTYGHSFGDLVLKEAAAAVSHTLRACDTFARWGGEEFIILMPGTNLDSAEKAAEKLRAALQAMRQHNEGALTASFGVAQYFKDEFIGSWFNRLDNALYDSKKNGRNRVSKSDAASNNAICIKIHWNSKWISGDQSIDEEHKELFESANEIMESSYQCYAKDRIMESAICFIGQFVKHYKHEEEILENIQYTELESHHQKHKRLEKKAIGMIDKLSENKINQQELFDFINSEIFRHIIEEDITHL